LNIIIIQTFQTVLEMNNYILRLKIDIIT